MSQAAGIPEEAKALIGQMAEPVVMEVERGAIRRFCDAVGDNNPLFRDVEYARKSKYGEIIAPPGFFGWPSKGGGLESMMAMVAPAMLKVGLFNILDGGAGYEYFLPVRAGDTLTGSAKVADISERTSAKGRRMLFVTIEITYLNQNGDTVAKAKNTIIAL